VVSNSPEQGNNTAEACEIVQAAFADPRNKGDSDRNSQLGLGSLSPYLGACFFDKSSVFP